MLRVLIANHGHRKCRVRAAGTIHRGADLGYLKAAHVAGVPLDLDDGEDGEIVVFPLALGLTGDTPPAEVWIELATGNRTGAAVPPRPVPSTGANSSDDH